MRRALPVAGAAIPLVALALTAGPGQVLDTTNFSSTHGNVSFVSAAQCAGTDPLHLEWNISPLQGATFAQNDQVKIFASDTNPATTSNGGFCDEKASTSPVINAGPIGTPLQPATTLLADRDVPGAGTDIKNATKIDCNTAEGTNVYICAHWYDSAGTTKKGFAAGTFQVQVNAPPNPSGLSAPQPGTGSLNVSWTANPTSPTPTDHYVAFAFLQGSAPAAGTKPSAFPTPVATETTQGPSATITGLENGTTYDIVVVAYSVAGNPSGASPSVSGTPVPSADFWDVYKARGGNEEGGCSAGAGGALSMLGAVALLALGRRKP